MTRLERIDPELQEILDMAEEMGWFSTAYIEPTQDDRAYVEMEKFSPAGEDFLMNIEFSKEDPASSFIYGLRGRWEDFDVDEHVEMWIPSRGKRGCPSSISTLVKDAEAIEDMIEELLDAAIEWNGRKAE